MAVPEAGNELSMLKIARERRGDGYNSSVNITAPIYFSDLSRLTGGNTSGSGVNYPAVNLNNPADQRPDGSDPQTFSEFYSYEQNLTRTAFYYAYDSSSPSGLCDSLVFDYYWHTDGNNLVPDAINTYYAYTTETGVTPVSAGYYGIYNSSFNSAGYYMYVNSSGLITQISTC